jgi:hypothetical protein
MVLVVLLSACYEAPEQQSLAGQQTASALDTPKRQPVVASATGVLPDSAQPAFEADVADQRVADPKAHEPVSEPASDLAGELSQSIEPEVVDSENQYGTNRVPLPAFVVTGDAGGVYWEPNLEAVDANSNANSYAHLELTLASPTGRIINRRFAAGEPVALSGIQGSLSDGMYKWETVTAPVIDEHVRTEMAVVRESGDFAAEQALVTRLRSQGVLPTEAQAQANVQSGEFTVRGGAVLPSNIVEK